MAGNKEETREGPLEFIVPRGPLLDQMGGSQRRTPQSLHLLHAAGYSWRWLEFKENTVQISEFKAVSIRLIRTDKLSISPLTAQVAGCTSWLFETLLSANSPLFSRCLNFFIFLKISASPTR